MAEKISIISLGCARNLVDSEVMDGILRQSRYQVVSDPAEADVVLINTCSFIDAAKEESIDTILQAARLKEEGKLRTLVVAGCLSQRYSKELMEELPEVDLFIGTGEVPRIAEILREHHESKKGRLYVGIPSYLYDHANNITIGEIHTNYATNQKIAQWDLGRNLYDNNPRYLIRR